MSLKESYLSKKIDGVKQYNVDMVTMIAENSLNSQMRAYLAHCDWETHIYFLKTTEDDGKMVLFMIDKTADESKIPEIFELKEKVQELKKNGSSVFNELEKLNLFALQSGIKSTDNPSVDIAMSEYSLGFAFTLADGLPKEIVEYLAKNRGKINPDDYLKIITVNPANNTVLFKQFFKKFEVLQINTRIVRNKIIGILTVDKQVCDPSNPTKGILSTLCSMVVDLRSVYHKDIADEEVRKKIKSMAIVQNPDTVFDISQLLLDLSTLQTVAPITIEGLAPEVEFTIKSLVNTYFNRLEKAGQTIFGHIVLPKPNMSVNYLFTPNIKNFAVTDNGFYYLINFKDDRAPVIPNLGNNRDFEWKPLVESKDNVDGAMVINATKFIPFVRDNFINILQKYAVDVNVYATGGVYKLNLNYGIHPDYTPQQLTVKEKQPWKASWSYASTHTQDWQFSWAPPAPWPVGTAKGESWYTATCETDVGSFTDRGITYPSYDFNFTVRGKLNVGYNSENNIGTYLYKSIKYQVGFKLDTDGHFNFISKTTKTDLPITDKIVTSAWGEFWSAGDLQNIIDAITNELSRIIDANANESITQFLSTVNTFVGWFMPGCRTFTYKNEGISTQGDFYTHVNYVQE